MFLLSLGCEMDGQEGRDREVAQRVGPRLSRELEAKGLKLGQPVFLRIFKDERELELWVKKGVRYEKFRSYRVAGMSGQLGPKLAEGDRQAPEGFYYVKKSAMNPRSRWHLSFNVGYPNAYDRAHGRTGSFIMVHGNWQSIGCFAMTDAKIEEIYTICDAALDGGQPFFRVHIFPFRMEEKRMREVRESRWSEFWRNLREGYDWFERHQEPPNVEVVERRYVFDGE